MIFTVETTGILYGTNVINLDTSHNIFPKKIVRVIFAIERVSDIYTSCVPSGKRISTSSSFIDSLRSEECSHRTHPTTEYLSSSVLFLSLVSVRVLFRACEAKGSSNSPHHEDSIQLFHGVHRWCGRDDFDSYDTAAAVVGASV